MGRAGARLLSVNDAAVQALAGADGPGVHPPCPPRISGTTEARTILNALLALVFGVCDA